MKYLDKLLNNLTSWKLWVFGSCFYLTLVDKLDPIHLTGIVVALITGRVAEYKWGNGNGKQKE